jgi:hypothetical protein
MNKIANIWPPEHSIVLSSNFTQFEDTVRRRFSIPSRWRFATVGLLLGFAASGASAATLSVGPGQQFSSIAAAVAASHDGDTINVAAGLYVNDFAEIRTKITLNAVGGFVRMQGRGYIPNQKGILLTDTDVTISGFELFGARVTDNSGANGAGIRYQGGNLTLIGCYVHDNQEGMLANPDPNGTITIISSEFYRNGNSSGSSAGYTHNLYVNQLAKLDIEKSYIHAAQVGHEIKSRASTTIVNNSRIADGLTGTASYSIDMPNGGIGIITGNMIEQGPWSQNPSIVAYGEEGGIYAASSLTMTNNIIENDMPNPYVRGLWNASGVAASMSGTRVFGLSSTQVAVGPATVSGTVWLNPERSIPTTHPWH